MRSALFRETITLRRYAGEDAGGHATYTDTSLTGAYFELTEAERATLDGAGRTRTSLAVLSPEGYGTTWTVEPGDLIVAKGKTVVTLGVTAVYQPRTIDTLHHVEVSCG